MNIAVYAGSFDPPTRGHIAVARRAARLFDHVRLIVAINPDKAPLFTPEERRSMLARALEGFVNISVDTCDGLTAKYARHIGATVLVRGVRDGEDARSELQLAHLNEALAPELQSVLVPAPRALQGVSSSGIKARLAAGEDVSAFLDPHVIEALNDRTTTDEEVAA